MEGRFDRPQRGGFRSFDRGPRRPQEKHKAVCSECKQECEVPFKPTEQAVSQLILKLGLRPLLGGALDSLGNATLNKNIWS